MYFNDARDNEQRAARHKSRSDMGLMSAAVSSASHRYSNLNHVDLTAADISSAPANASVHADTFRAHRAPDRDFLHFDPQ
eukprot:8590188-Pyramimonas_sp.AAC.1